MRARVRGVRGEWKGVRAKVRERVRDESEG